MEYIKNTQTVKNSALHMTAYERAGTIDTRAYAVDEVVRPYIKAMDDNEEKRVAYALELVKAGY